MKKIIAIIALVVLLTPTVVLADQQEEEIPEGECVWAFDKSNANDECNKYCNNWVFQTASQGYETFEKCEECRLEFIEEQEEENETEEPEVPPKLDLVFVIDTTGSMSDEIREVKMHIKNIIEEIENGEPKPDIMIGFVVYRDYKDEENEYLTKKFDLTTDIEAAKQFLDELKASGGGDYKETVTIGLDVGINEMNWREIDGDSDGEIIYDDQQNPIYTSTENRRMIFLIGDAPPRTRPFEDDQGNTQTPKNYKENIEDAKNKGIYVYTVSGSGMDSEGIEIWKEISEETNAAYEALVYERVTIDDYVETHDLDEEWKEEVRSDRDYTPSDDGVGFGTISTNQMKEFVLCNVQIQAEAVGVKYVEDIEHPIVDDPIIDETELDSDAEKLERFLLDAGWIWPFSVFIFLI